MTRDRMEGGHPNRVYAFIMAQFHEKQVNVWRLPGDFFIWAVPNGWRTNDMTQKLLIVDFENVQQVNLSKLGDGFNAIVFVGTNQKSIPIDLVIESQKLGSRLEWQRVEGNGSNALDFFIACHLGRVLEKAPGTTCVILSKDKGFDPLLMYLNKVGLKCSRVNSLMELGPELTGPDEPNYKKVVEALDKNRKTRPRKRKTLSQFIFANIFLGKLPQDEVDKIIDLLFAHKMISETNNTLTYEF